MSLSPDPAKGRVCKMGVYMTGAVSLVPVAACVDSAASVNVSGEACGMEMLSPVRCF